MQKPLYADALLILKSWKRNMTTRQTRQSGRDAVSRRPKTSSGKRNMQGWQRKRCGKWEENKV